MKFFIIFTTAFFAFLQISQADIFSQTFGEEELGQGEVVVERPVDLTGSYKERRTTHGALVSVMYEKYFPASYRSQSTSGEFTGDLIGEDRISLVGVEAGYKYNFSLGSIALLGSYAMGKSDPNKKTVLQVARTAFSANFALDNFLQEPWVVPYAQGGLYTISIGESVLTNATTGERTSYSAASDWALNYKYGLMFQLNALEKMIDPQSHTEGLRTSGLQNAFIDVYYMDHIAASDAIDPANPLPKGGINTGSAGEIGVGLKIEF